MRRAPLHPLLFATFPVLFLFVENAERVRFGKVPQPLLAVLIAVTAVTVLAFVVFRSLQRAAIVGSGFAILALSYGHVWTAVQDKAIAGFVVGRDLFLLPQWFVLGLLVLLLAWRAKSLGEITLILNVVAFGLVAVSGINTVIAVSNQGSVAFQANPGKRSGEVPKASGAGTKRDIFYLIFDRYGSAPVLEKYYGYDNSPFIDALRERGFFVADNAISNYPKTAHSVASSLNMEYLDGLAEREGADSKDWKPLYRTIPDPKVARFLREQGYRYAHIGPWYDPTASDPTAHVNYHYDKRSEFSRVLIETTLLHPVAKRLGFLKDLDGRQVAHNQIRFQFDSILDASDLPGSTYTFAHLLIPHQPFTFAADGSYVSEERGRAMTRQQGYIGQVEYANGRILGIVDKVLAGPDSEDPIIVLQADEGPPREDSTFGTERRWEEAPDEELEQKFGILSAYHLPGRHPPDGRGGLYPEITPVNSFRVIFNRYFGTDLELRPDRAYVFGRADEPYRLTDVTDRLRPR